MQQKGVVKKIGVVKKYGKKWTRSDCEEINFQNIKRYRGKRPGLYVLYQNKKIVYIGRSTKNIRKRLVDHTKDRLRDKWDSFSWFLTKKELSPDLEALLFSIFWSYKEIEWSWKKANFVKAKRYPQSNKRC